MSMGCCTDSRLRIGGGGGGGRSGETALREEWKNWLGCLEPTALASHLLLGCFCQVSQAGCHVHQALLEGSHQVSLPQTDKEELKAHAAMEEGMADTGVV